MATQLQHSPARILSVALIAETVVTAPTGDPAEDAAWPCHYAEEPDKPDDCVTIYDTVGKQFGGNMHDGSLFAEQGFQVRVRANGHDRGWRKADELQQTLARGLYLENLTIESKTYVLYCVGDVSEVNVLGKEAPTSNRRLYTINGTLAIRATN